MSTDPQPSLRATFSRFVRAETFGGILLLVCTSIALAWSNSPGASSYHEFWRFELTVGIEGGWGLTKPLLVWINDALMALFFFVVGLEIKREILVGELSSLRKALLPIAAAFGGMLVPVVVYLLLAAGAGAGRGWAIPMATDIAFSLGVLALLGRRVPLGLKVFLTALAIVDDIGGVVVIAFFYTEQISLVSLSLGGLFLAAMIALNFAGVRKLLPYFLLGAALWLCFLKSGVHPTVAGVLGALTIPVRTRIDSLQFVEMSRVLIDHFERVGRVGEGVLTNKEQRAALSEIDKLNSAARSPLHRLEHTLHPWVTFLVMPIFALANAGVTLEGDLASTLTHRLPVGIAVGLILGKFTGILGASFVTVRLGVSTLPRGVSWRHILGASALAGIGFTMSLFIAGLAFENEPDLVPPAKMGILAGSIVSAVIGALILRSAPRSPDG